MSKAIKLLKSIKNNKLVDAKTTFDSYIKEAIQKKLEEKKAEVAKKYMGESESSDEEEEEVEEASAPEVDPGPSSGTKPILLRPDGHTYRYMFEIFSKTFYVDFVPVDKSAQDFSMTFYVRGKDKSELPNVKYGISSVSMIEPLFASISTALRLFIDKRHPSTIKMIPSGGTSFPTVFHMRIFDGLQSLQRQLKGKYSVSRKASGDGSAFIVHRGAGSNSLQGKSFKSPVSEPEEPPVK